MTWHISAPKGGFTQLLLLGAGAGLFATAVGTTLKSALTGVREVTDVALQVGLTISMEVGLLVAVHHATAAFCRKEWMKAAALLPMVVLFATGAVQGSGGYVYERHERAVEARTRAATAAIDVENERILRDTPVGKEVDYRRRLLLNYITTRETKTIRSEIEACSKTRRCTKMAELMKQEEYAEQRDALRAQLEQLEKDLPEAVSRPVVDPSVQLFTRVMPHLDPDQVALGGVILWLLILQLGPALCVAAAQVVAAGAPLGPSATQNRREKMERLVHPPTDDAINSGSGVVSPPSRRGESHGEVIPPLSAEARRAIEAVKSAGGEVRSARHLAHLAQWDRRAMARGVRAAALAGKLILERDGRGTRIRLPH